MECPVVVCETISCVLLRVNVKPCIISVVVFGLPLKMPEDRSKTLRKRTPTARASTVYIWNTYYYRRYGIRI